jgi:DNA end-binding protein Ku
LDVKLKPEGVKLADRLIQNVSAPFKPEAYQDEFQERLNELITSRLQGKPLTVSSKKAARAPVIDMMQALKKSLAARGSTKREDEGVSLPHRSRRKAS